MAYYYNQLSNQPIVNWETAHSGWVPHERAVIGGHDVNNEPLYVGRALCGGDVIPGKIVQSHRTCYVPWAQREHAVKDYQVLATSGDAELKWLSAADGDVPCGAIEGGRTGNGEKLYIGRAHHQGSHVIGKVHPSHKVVYIPFDGKEIPLNSYEVLCIKSVSF